MVSDLLYVLLIYNHVITMGPLAQIIVIYRISIVYHILQLNESLSKREPSVIKVFLLGFI